MPEPVFLSFTPYKTVLKPIIDKISAICGLIFFSPFLLIIPILLSIANRGTPFFIQPRPGKGGKIFKLIKFKTMNDRRDKEGNLLPDEQRLTRIGKIIRKLSLDELPQLINVLKGDMSLVGQRPLLVEYLPLYSPEQRRRHEVKPGITGWAQVNGRNAISWEEKFRYDVWYVDNVSFALDMKILFLTVLKVFKREGISQEGMATVEYFNGKN
jgi:lipopolysaccharide/colanic/teichoic acid biosynthesis glycosyltransferase